MGKTLYLLKDESIQVDYPTLSKYLFNSKLNSEIVRLMESQSCDFLYLSHMFGILEPNSLTEPYKISRIIKRRTWVTLTAELINRYCLKKKYSDIVLMFSGDKFQDLEELLIAYGYSVEQPMKHFRTKKMQILWIYNKIHASVIDRLSSNTNLEKGE
jgi:hypothetical protein